MSRRSVVAGVVLACWCAAGPAREAHAQDSCQAESECSFKKPNILLVLDYSSSMSGFAQMPAYFPPGQTTTTRWGAELDAASWILRYQDGFFADNARIGLTRFAHDPDVKDPGTTLVTDTSFPSITDGFAIDVPFDGTDGDYLECKGSGVEAAVEVLRGTPPPPIAAPFSAQQIMLTWTRGALRSAHELVTRTRENHKKESGEKQRDYEVVLMTDGDWTCPDKIGQTCDEDPSIEAALLQQDGVPVSVIAFGDATMTPSLNEVALQGGTQQSIDATSPQGIVDAFSSVLDRIRDSVIVPECTGKLPRVLVIMDASSSMIAGNTAGATKWDKARFALSGNPDAPKPKDAGYVEPLLRRTLEVGGRSVAIEDVVHLGMVAFAGADQQKLMVGFGPCMRDNFAWAMDPHTSCEKPGCTDPYAGYPIEWTFKNSDKDRKPPFVRQTQSYMPACNETQGSNSCVGQIANTFTGQGLAFAHSVVADYKREPAPFHVDDNTRFVNVLITDGQTSQGSSNVQNELEAMVKEGIDTYVIGFGSDAELDANQLQQYAMWGNTKSAILVDPSDAAGANALADALSGVVMGLGLDACCVLDDCAAQPEPADPRPVCGDGRVEGDEVCDDGKDNATYGHCGGRCDGPHLYCGDNRVDGPEQCDDGNTKSGDGCDADCQNEGDSDAGMDTSQMSGSGGQSMSGGPGTGGRGGSVTPPPKRQRAPVDGGEADGGAGGAHKASSDCGCYVITGSREPHSSAGFTAVALALYLRRRRKQRAS